MSENKSILNIKEVAERIGVPTVTLRYWLRVGKCPIPHLDMKPPKWLAADVDAFLAGRDTDGE